MSWSARSAAGKIDVGDADVVVVVGPTASGKSDLALALAETRSGEIVGADSVQVYRHFDIGSSKPTRDEQARVTHHLVDVVDPTEPMDAASYADRAASAIAGIIARGSLPIVCGGTFLWIRALLYGLAEAPAGDPRPAAGTRRAPRPKVGGASRRAGEGRSRERATSQSERSGPGQPGSRGFRGDRASLSVWQSEHGFRTPRYRAKLIGIRWSHEMLVERIAIRTERALASGWMDEVEDLVRRGYRDTRAMSSVGYRQILACVEGRLARDELKIAIDRATKVFARRQRTWLRDRPIDWLDRTS